jgi:hypothetical protein
VWAKVASFPGPRDRRHHLPPFTQLEPLTHSRPEQPDLPYSDTNGLADGSCNDFLFTNMWNCALMYGICDMYLRIPKYVTCIAVIYCGKYVHMLHRHVCGTLYIYV